MLTSAHIRSVLRPIEGIDPSDACGQLPAETGNRPNEMASQAAASPATRVSDPQPMVRLLTAAQTANVLRRVWTHLDGADAVGPV